MNTEQRLDDLMKRFNKYSSRESRGNIGDAVSSLIYMPAVRAIWPFSSINESGSVYDISGQARTLTASTTITFSDINGIAMYASLNGSTQYFSRADEASLDITGNLTIGGWFYANALASDQTCMSKWTASGNIRAYQIQIQTGGQGLFAVSSNGTAVTTVTGSAAKIPAATWVFLCGRYTVSTELAVFVNEEKTVNTTSIPASIYNTTASLLIGGISAAASLAGRCGMCFISAYAIPDAGINNLYNSSRILFGV